MSTGPLDMRSDPGHLGESHEASTTLGAPTRLTLRLFTFFFTRLAAHGKREGPQPSSGNLTLAFDTQSIPARVESSDRSVDVAEQLRLHLQQGQRQLALDVVL
jgi:hypothetical protein